MFLNVEVQNSHFLKALMMMILLLLFGKFPPKKWGDTPKLPSEVGQCS